MNIKPVFNGLPREIASKIICEYGAYNAFVWKNVCKRFHSIVRAYTKKNGNLASMWPSEACTHAIVHGYAKPVEWLKDQLVLNRDAIDGYAMSGDIIAVKRLRDFKFHCSIHTFHCACFSGNLELVKYIKAVGFCTPNHQPRRKNRWLNISPYRTVIQRGHLDILEFMMLSAQPALEKSVIYQLYELAIMEGQEKIYKRIEQLFMPENNGEVDTSDMPPLI